MHLQIIRPSPPAKTLIHVQNRHKGCNETEQCHKQILDAVLIANEVIDSILKSNGRAILCKLDIEKAYDHVEWSFLLTDMEKMGLLSKLYGPKAGRPAFILPFCDSNGSPWLAFKESSLWWLFIGLSSARLKVNLDKSELIPMGRVENVDYLTCELDCKVGSLPSTYLGMSLGAPFNSVTAWDGSRWVVFLEVWEEYGVGLWKAIRKLGHLVNTRLSFVVGNGQREAKVSDMRTVLASGEKGGGRELEPCFTRPFNVWELVEVENLLGRLCGERVLLDEEDEVSGLKSKDGNFSAKSLYKVLEPDSSVCFP
ncbi:hypothetical protein CK203_098384 [Vitis vinifera]|uniref:Reverse transcriptase domain-containing protein n=1 Tax=Vitis vinifera TaxID=29760 RepID=A0A438C6E4_VITVI|nr:hypothetical protein CK203_098384 [Vitis vinifera]